MKKNGNKHVCIINRLLWCLFLSMNSILVFAQETDSLEQYVNDYYQYMESIDTPKPDIEVLTKILNLIKLNPEGNFVIEDVVQMPGQSKEKLFDASVQYLVDIFNDSKSVIQMQDKESGIIAVKGNTKGFVQFNEFLLGKYTYEETVSFTLKIQFKDERYRYEIYNIICKEEFYPEFPIEIYLIPSFYNKGNKPANKYPIESSSKRYINIRSQLLITELHSLFKLKKGLNKYIFDNMANKNNNW